MLHPKGFAPHLLRWYDRCRRELPWRRPRNAADAPLDPYHVLVSETMLQQTQVATVIAYFERFIKRFPNWQTLAEAEEQEVLRLWQGLGYYSRARNLRRAAQTVVKDHTGQLPDDLELLQRLPGVGRYTAGAIASIAFERPAPILDGNVARVLCRLDALSEDPRQPAAREQLWRRAEEILPGKRLGDFNSALMELGALICTPRQPQCLLCPVRKHCQAFELGIQQQIPPPRKARETPLYRRWTFCISRGKSWLIEQRPARGRWAGMWQFPTVEAGTAEPTARDASAIVVSAAPRRIGAISHALTHRRYEFEVYCSEATGKKLADNGPNARRWVRLDELDQYPLPRPHLMIADLLRVAPG